MPNSAFIPIDVDRKRRREIIVAGNNFFGDERPLRDVQALLISLGSQSWLLLGCSMEVSCNKITLIIQFSRKADSDIFPSPRLRDGNKQTKVLKGIKVNLLSKL